MTVEEIKTYYANLLILQYIGKERARAHVKTLAGAAIIDLLPLAVRDAFDIETAAGVQLDIIGDIVAQKRNGYILSGAVVLNDDDYRTALKLKILQNNSGSSLYDIQVGLDIFFRNQIQVFDYLDMRIGYYFDSSVGNTDLIEFFLTQDLLPRPAAVQLSSTIYGNDKFFGYRTYQSPGVNNSPYNTYEDYEMDRPFLTYEDAVII